MYEDVIYENPRIYTLSLTISHIPMPFLSLVDDDIIDVACDKLTVLDHIKQCLCKYSKITHYISYNFKTSIFTKDKESSSNMDLEWVSHPAVLFVKEKITELIIDYNMNTSSCFIMSFADMGILSQVKWGYRETSS